MGGFRSIAIFRSSENSKARSALFDSKAKVLQNLSCLDEEALFRGDVEMSGLTFADLRSFRARRARLQCSFVRPFGILTGGQAGKHWNHKVEAV